MFRYIDNSVHHLCRPIFAGAFLVCLATAPAYAGCGLFPPGCTLDSKGTMATNETKICKSKYAVPKIVMLSKSPITASGGLTKISYLMRMDPGSWKTCTRDYQAWNPKGWRMSASFIPYGPGKKNRKPQLIHVTLNKNGAYVGSTWLSSGQWLLTGRLILPGGNKNWTSEKINIVERTGFNSNIFNTKE